MAWRPVVEEMHQAMVEIHRSGLTILLVEQNTRLALSVAEHAYVLQSGAMALSGNNRELMEDSRVRKAYLGL